MAAGSAAVVTSFLTNLYVFLGCFTLFTFVRVRPWAKRFFAPRRYAKDVDIKPKRLSTNLIGWIKPVMWYKEEAIIDEAGMDAAMYLRVVWFGMELFFVLTLICIPLVLPPNMTSGEIDRLLAQEEALANPHVDNNITVFADRVNFAHPGADGSRLIVSSYSNGVVMFNGTATTSGVSDAAYPEYNVNVTGNSTAKLSGFLLNGLQDSTFLRNTTILLDTVAFNGVIPNGSRYAQVYVLTRVPVDSSTSVKVNGKEFKFTDFDKYSLSNIEEGSDKMWCHLIAMYMVVLFTLWRLREYNLQSVYLRLLYLGNAKRGGPSHTVLVTDIPHVKTAVDCGLKAQEHDKQMSRKTSMGKSFNNATFEGPADYMEPGTGVPVSEPALELKLSSAKSVAIKEPLKSTALLHTDGSMAATHSELNGDRGGADGHATATAFAVAPSSEAADGGGSQQRRGTKGGLLSIGPGLEECRKYRLADPTVDPDFAATGGKLIMARTGRTKEKVLEDLKREEPEPTYLPPGFGVDTRVLKPDRRQLKRFRYDVKKLSSHPVDAMVRMAKKAMGKGGGQQAEKDKDSDVEDDIKPQQGPITAQAMDPDEQAKAKLQAGLTPQQMVAQEFAMVYQPYNVAAVNMIQDTDKLEPLVTEYNMISEKLEDYLDMAKLRLKLRKALPPAMVRISPKLQGEEWQPVKKEMERGIRAQFVYEREMNQKRTLVLSEQLGVEKEPKERKLLEDRINLLFRELNKMPGCEAKALTDLDRIADKSWSKKVDAVTYWLARLKYLRKRIKHEQWDAERRMAPSAFVTFNTRMAQGVASNSLHAHAEDSWRSVPAPAPIEVVWQNLSMTHAIRSGRLYLLWTAFWMMTLFFMVPVSLIQAIIEVPKLASIPVLGDIVTAPVIRQLLEAIIPGLVLKLFLIIVPHILWAMALLSGATSVSEIDFGVASRFYLFQVVVVFFGSIIAGSFFNQLKQWVEDPASVISTLGKSIPMTATFFITYIFVNGLAVKSIQFIRLPAFCIFWILSKFAGSPRARERMWTNQFIFYGVSVPDHTMCILLGLVFCCMNPIVCPSALAYFLVAVLGERYNCIYVYRQKYESAGRLWKTIYNQIMSAVYIMLFTMFGLLAIKKFKWVFFLVPLILYAIGTHMGTLSMYSRPWSVTALHDAAEMDMLEADQRREQLLAAAKEERKKGKMEQKRRYEAACVEAEAHDLPLPPASDFYKELLPGKSEKLLVESLQGDGFALNSAEKKEIEDMYRNPGFTLPLEHLEEMEKLSKVVQSLLPDLNDFVAAYRSYRHQAQRNKRTGETKPVPAPIMPEDLTIFDNDPRLVRLDAEMAAADDDDATETASLAAEPAMGDARV